MSCKVCSNVLFYLFLLLLPQTLWLLNNEHWFFSVCESCSNDIDTIVFSEIIGQRQNTWNMIGNSSVKSSAWFGTTLVEANDEMYEFSHDDDQTALLYSKLCACAFEELDDENNYDQFNTAADGGWTTLGDFPDLTGPCNIKRVDVSDLSQQDFEKRFVYKEPVVMTGIPEQTEFKVASTKYKLLRNYGHDIITVATANTHSYRKEKVTLCEYVQTMMDAQTLDTLGNETLYYFGDNNREGWSELFNRYSLPPVVVPGTSPVLSFGLAGPGTGVPFHIHGATFAETFYGRKRWFLYPPDYSPRFNPDQSTLHWLHYTYPHLVTDNTLLECTLNPGEVIYFPDKWWHATLNVDTAVFMSTFYS